jgi:hypothetical protein
VLSCLYAAHRLAQSSDQQPKPVVCCVLPLWPRVDPEQAAAIAVPDLELDATANLCLVGDVVWVFTPKVQVGRNFSLNPYGSQFMQNDTPQFKVMSANLNFFFSL